MNTNEHELHPEHVHNPEVNFERRDLSARGVLLFLLALAVTAVFMHFILFGMFRYLGRGVRREPASTAIATPERTLPQGDPARAFPPPQLQPDPVADLNKFRTRQEQILSSYDWVDKDKQIVRIPIDRAMQVLLQRGLPARPTGQVAVPSAVASGSGQPRSNTAAMGGNEPVKR